MFRTHFCTQGSAVVSGSKPREVVGPQTAPARSSQPGGTKNVCPSLVLVPRLPSDLSVYGGHNYPKKQSLWKIYTYLDNDVDLDTTGHKTSHPFGDNSTLNTPSKLECQFCQNLDFFLDLFNLLAISATRALSSRPADGENQKFPSIWDHLYHHPQQP